ncbi:hypothetical protein ELQ92_14370 [Labedella populi]|uniref:Uncharacterized protein n=1 Tax=Labedella populi TaxID=2498850 RepID=A0A444Q401_9MICO|nr:hypothetical protein ELQ92_14370 [Labedella populi]
MGHVLSRTGRSGRALRAAIAVGALVVTCSIAGCASATGDRPGGGSAGSDDTETLMVPPTPFEGPWAELLMTMYGIGTTAEREALADGAIDELEYSYFRDRIVECLGDLGVEASFAADSTLEYTPSDEAAEDDADACMGEGGIQVLTLKDTIDRNPENLDEATIMVECLQEAGLVGPEYTARDYVAGVGLSDHGDDDAFAECTADPLGLLER